jgi:glycosyltransferase involved in cell wall biosynthesis
MADYLQLFDILVFPSLFSEGCPRTLLEGMALGKAVIGARSGAIPEVILDRRNGLLVNPGSAQELGEAIAELASNPSLRARLGQQAMTTAVAMNGQHEREEWLDVYRSACGCAEVKQT